MKLFQISYNGTEYLGVTKEKLADKVIEREKIIYHPEIFRQKVIDNCAIFDTGKGRSESVPSKNKGKKLKFREVIAGASALFHVIVGQVEPQEEINRRAAICSKCPKLTMVSNCKACGFGAKLSEWNSILKKTFGKKDFEIPNNHSDKYCSICSCSLTIMLPSKLSAFAFDEDHQKERPNHCWIKKGSPNFAQTSLDEAKRNQ